MNAIKFMKYDVRKSKKVLLLSIVVFTPLAILMGYNLKSVYLVFTYMALVASIAPATLFTYEQKNDCGFDNMLPATDMERVQGRFLTGIFFIVIELIIGFVASGLLISLSNLKMPDVLCIILFFTGITLMYISLSNTLFWVVGKRINQQLRSLLIIIPTMLFWGLANAIVLEFAEGHFINEIFAYILKHLEIVGIIMLLVGITAYIAGILICTYVVRKKDFR